MTDIVEYGRNIIANGIDVDGLLFENSTVGKNRANLAFDSTVTSSSAIILSDSSPQTQHLSGSSSQTIILPPVNSLVEGLTFHLFNKASEPIYVFSADSTTTTSGATFPVGTIDVISTTGFPSSGTIYIMVDDGSVESLTYSGLTATSFTGCLGGSGNFLSGSPVAQYLVIRISSSNQANIVCVDTTGVDGTDGWTPFVLPIPIFDSFNTIPFPTSQSQGVWIGENVATNHSSCIGIGAAAISSASGTAIGTSARTSDRRYPTSHVGIGYRASATGFSPNNNYSVVAIGRNAYGLGGEGGTRYFSVGTLSQGGSCGQSAIGNCCIGKGAIGSGGIRFRGNEETLIGADTRITSGQGSGDIVLIGYGTTGRGYGNVGNSGQTAIGHSAYAGGLRSTVVGYDASSSSSSGRDNPQGHGWRTEANWRNCAIGHFARAIPPFGTQGVIVMGHNAVTMSNNYMSWAFNPSSIHPGFFGLALNGEARQIPAYTNYYTSSTTSGTTLVYSATTQRDRYFSGTSNQLVTLPNVSTLTNGHYFKFINNSTGIVTIQSSVPSTIVTLPAGSRIDVVCIDDTAASGTDGWFAEMAKLASVPTTLPSLVSPTNYYATLKGVPVGGLYRSSINSPATATTTFAITSSFSATGTTLTVTGVGGVIVPGMFLSGGSVVPGTQILSGPGGVGSYVVDTVNTIGVTPTSVAISNAIPDELFVRSA